MARPLMQVGATPRTGQLSCVGHACDVMHVATELLCAGMPAHMPVAHGSGEARRKGIVRASLVTVCTTKHTGASRTLCASCSTALAPRHSNSTARLRLRISICTTRNLGASRVIRAICSTAPAHSTARQRLRIASCSTAPANITARLCLHTAACATRPSGASRVMRAICSTAPALAHSTARLRLHMRSTFYRHE